MYKGRDGSIYVFKIKALKLVSATEVDRWALPTLLGIIQPLCLLRVWGEGGKPSNPSELT